MNTLLVYYMYLFLIFDPECGDPRHDHTIIYVAGGEHIVVCPCKRKACCISEDLPKGEVLDFLDTRLKNATVYGRKVQGKNISIYLRDKLSEPTLATK